MLFLPRITSILWFSFFISWEHRKLGDIGKTYGGLSGKAKEDFGHGDAKFVTYMNVFSNPVGDPAMTEAIELDSRQNEIKKGDIFFTTSSETPDEVGMSSVWMENMPNTYLNSFCFGYRPTLKFDLYYLAYVLRSDSIRNKFIFLAQGISRYNISKNKVMEMSIPIPSMEEQVFLGKLFKNLDNLITLHQRKQNGLNLWFLSKKCTSNLANEWEQCKLGDIVSVCSGKDYKHLGEGDIPVYGTGGYMLSVSDALSYSDDAIGIGRKGTIDKPYILKAPFWTVDTLFYAVPKEKKALDFVYCLFQIIDWKSKDESTGVPSLSKIAINSVDVSIPKSEEQVQIGTVFLKIDNLITLHQCKEKSRIAHADKKVMFHATLKLANDWEQRKLGEIAIEVNRTDANSNAPIMMITANDGFIEQSERYAFNNAGESLKRYIVLQKGELAYNHGASKLRPYGSCFALIKQEKARIPFVYHCFSVENHNPEFVSIELNGNDVESQLRRIVSSGARMDGLLNISFQDYASISILLPEKAEQDKIASVFRNLDNLITLHQREQKDFSCHAGEIVKLQKNQKLTDDWEQRKLGEISRTTIGEFVIRTKQNDNSPYPVYNGGTSFTGFYEEFNNEGNKIIISARGANAGFVNVVKTRYWAGNSCYSVDLLDKIHFDTDFIYHEMKRNQSRFLDNQQAANIPSVSKTDVEKFNIDLPQVDEQKRISKFFDQIDSLITLHQRGENKYKRRQT